MRTIIGFAILLLAGCGASSDPAISSCLDACGTENKCSGAKQQNCSSLCNARPKDCTKEYADYWSCADAHLADACTSYPSCNDVFGKLSTCIVAYCLVFALDSACYYQK